MFNCQKNLLINDILAEFCQIFEEKMKVATGIMNARNAVGKWEWDQK